MLPVQGPLDPRWYDAIATRISRRRFDGRPVGAEDLEQLKAAATSLEQRTGVRTIIGEDPTGSVFTGVAGSYGKITGAPTVALFVGSEDSRLHAGYAGEAFLLEATRLGLDTCWVAGSFDRKRSADLVRLQAGEVVLAVTPIGYGSTRTGSGERALQAFVKARSRKPIEQIAPGMHDRVWPAWAVTAAEAARRAPSGGNAQPWRFSFDEQGLVLSSADNPYWTAEFDFGIAMLHVELGAAHEGVRGRWIALEPPAVARFEPQEP
jgi:hypothetical protein